MAIGGPLTATKGYAAPEVERTYLRARELCERLGRSSELFPALRGLWNCYFTRGELLRGADLAERLAVLAEEQGRSLQRALAHRSLGSTWLFLGRFSEAREQLDQAIAFDEAVGSGNRRAYISLYADSPGVIGRLISLVSSGSSASPSTLWRRSRRGWRSAKHLRHQASMRWP